MRRTVSEALTWFIPPQNRPHHRLGMGLFGKSLTSRFSPPVSLHSLTDCRDIAAISYVKRIVRVQLYQKDRCALSRVVRMISRIRKLISGQAKRWLA